MLHHVFFGIDYHESYQRRGLCELLCGSQYLRPWQKVILLTMAKSDPFDHGKK